MAKEQIIKSDDENLNPELMRAIISCVEGEEVDTLQALIGELHQSDLADILENMPADKRTELIRLQGEKFKIETLIELDEPVRDKVVDALPNEQVADVIRQLDSDDAVALLEDMDEAEQSDILAKIPEADRASLKRSLDFPEDSAGRLMQAEFIAVPPFWSIGQTIDYMRETDDLPHLFSEIFVINPDFHLLGIVPLDRLLRAKRPTRISDVMQAEHQHVAAELDQEEVARQFERYNLLSAPVLDQDERLLGIITIDDVVDVIQEEAEEDIHRLGGVGDEALTDTVLGITKSRFSWLVLNLMTAILASYVISLFDTTINEMVALAILMPIVASMGGNAATQSMTVAVRALATKELTQVNVMRVITREALVGLMNGLLFSFLVALVTVVWFGNQQLSIIIAAAMVFNMLVAGLAGIMIPVTLEHFDIDPAVASTVFVTTVTDVVGFFSFLGLAAWWLH